MRSPQRSFARHRAQLLAGSALLVLGGAQALAAGNDASYAALGSTTLHPASAGGGSPAERAVGAPLSPDDVDFLAAAEQSGILQVRAGETAVTKSSKRDVRALAELTILEHTVTNDRLRELAAAKGVKLPEELDRAHRAKLTALEELSGASFDVEYVRDAGIVAHEQAVKLFEKGAISDDTDIRRFAETALPGLREELNHAHRIEDDSMARQVSVIRRASTE